MNEPIRIIIESIPKNKASLIEIINSFLTPMIAIITIYIAYQQWRVNYKKIKIDLSDRRVKAFREIEQYILLIIRNGNIEVEQCHSFFNAMRIEGAIFKKNDQKYIKYLYEKGIELWEIHTRLYDRNGNAINMDKTKQRSKDTNSVAELLKWFNQQSTAISDKFKR